MSFLYQKHFGLSKPPFQITPNIDYFFSGSRRGDILTALLHIASHDEGIFIAVAEVGSGKTLLARLMISRLPEQISSVYLANPCFSRDEIISAIARDLGLTNLPATLEEKLASLRQELLRRHANGERVLLVIDEAHAMPVESLEEVRLLSNLETAQHKLINIMLFGQPELDELLADRRLRQLRDRIIHRFELLPFSHEDGVAYLDHRLRIAGWQGGKLFMPNAEALLLKAAGGRARRINLLADKSLLAAYAEGAHQITRRHVKSACAELRTDPAASPGSPGSTTHWKKIALASLVLATLMTGSVLLLLGPAPMQAQVQPTSAASASVPSTSAPAPETGSPPQSLKSPETAAWERTAELLKNPAAHGYTLQIATLPADDHLKDYVIFVGRYVDASLIYAHNGSGQGGRYVAVSVGQYATKEEAKAGLNNLPAPLKVNQPLIRTWAKIRQETAL